MDAGIWQDHGVRQGAQSLFSYFYFWGVGGRIAMVMPSRMAGHMLGLRRPDLEVACPWSTVHWILIVFASPPVIFLFISWISFLKLFNSFHVEFFPHFSFVHPSIISELLNFFNSFNCFNSSFMADCCVSKVWNNLTSSSCWCPSVLSHLILSCYFST